MHSPAGLICIAYRLRLLVHRNIQVTTITIGYIQLCQGFECWHVDEELAGKFIILTIVYSLKSVGVVSECMSDYNDNQ